MDTISAGRQRFEKNFFTGPTGSNSRWCAEAAGGWRKLTTESLGIDAGTGNTAANLLRLSGTIQRVDEHAGLAIEAGAAGSNRFSRKI
jgi:hypothetical protein